MSWIAALVPLAALILGAAGWGGRMAWRVMSRTTRFLDDFFGAEGRPGVMARLAALEQSLDHVVAETRPDHGHSLRDVAVRTAGDVAEIKHKQELIQQRMELLEAARAEREDKDR